jgi:hypothetical protein
MADEQKEVVKPPKKKIEKPLNPLAQKPGQKYGSTKFEQEKTFKEVFKFEDEKK